MKKSTPLIDPGVAVTFAKGVTYPMTSVIEEIKLLPPLRCPQCQSECVAAGFSKPRGRAWVNDGNIWCYDCKKVTNTRTGKVKSHDYDIWKADESSIATTGEDD